MTLIIIGIVLVVLAAIAGVVNVASMQKGMFAAFDEDDDFGHVFGDFGRGFGRQAIIAVVGIIGFALIVVGILTLVTA